MSDRNSTNYMGAEAEELFIGWYDSDRCKESP